MRVSVFTLGSRGDVQPFISLSRRLKQDGVDVELLTGSEFEEVADSEGVPVRPLSIDMGRLVQSSSGRRAIAGDRGQAEVSMKEQLRRVREQAGDYLSGRDALIFHPVVAPFAAKFASQHGLRLIQGALKPTPTQPESPQTLFAYSRHLVATEEELERHKVTGFWYHREQLGREASTPGGDDYAPSSELEAFLDAGDPPIYVGFGSMSSLDPAELTGAVLEAVERQGLRAILAPGWGGLEKPASGEFAMDPERVLWVDDIPHHWLFERVRCVVFHGGIGTLATALRAGRPMVICPFGIDQPFWARVMEGHGIAPPGVPQSRLNSETLSEALREAGQESMRAAAERMAEKLREEDGLASASHWVSQWLETV